MQPVLNIEDVRYVEKSLSRVGVSVSELMHRAGSAVAQEVMNIEGAKRICVLCGFGNNAGDGWVAAQVLHAASYQVCVVSPAPLEDLSSDLARVVAESAQAAGVEVVVGPPKDVLEQMLASSDVIVDAMLGTGFHGQVATPFDIWIEACNSSGQHVISVDVPSGLSAQTGHAANCCIIADTTVTMLALKPGLLADEARDVCGSIVVAPLAEQTEELVVEADPVAWRTEAADYLDVIPAPTYFQDKYSRGTVLVIGGSARYPGAAIMAAKAAARAGVGYVTLAVPAPCVMIAQMHLVDIPVVGLPSDEKGMFSPEAARVAAKLAKSASSVLVGPGMGVSAANVQLMSALLETRVPLVVDADGLNCLARLTANRLDNFPELIRRTSPLILTPHARELGRLMGLPDTPPNSLTACLEASRRIVWADGGSELVVVSKGTATACVGVEAAILPKPGPACLATAGTGDVLSGIIAGFVAHMKPSTEELVMLCGLAVEVHGVAGRMAAQKFGSEAVVATDLIDQIGLAYDAVVQSAAWPDELA